MNSFMFVSFSVNFKEPEAVRALTCTLLKEDFGLTIEIPLERLIPTVPLRLNYIHWVEDLIDGQKQPRRGIDIGTFISSSLSVDHVICNIRYDILHLNCLSEGHRALDLPLPHTHSLEWIFSVGKKVHETCFLYFVKYRLLL